MAGEESVLKSREPLVFRNALDNWKVFHWTFDDWTHFFRGQPLKFRVGSKKCSKEPQWERSSRTTTMTLDEFKNLAVEDSDSWYYFDYKHLNEYCDHDTSFLDDINWSCVGLPERSGKDSTLWIGSKGAHTPCHIDTYGCNFVAQIFGRKRWLLFPPDTVQLKPSRIPYEESSIYTHINFQCSRNYDPKLIEKAFSVELDPGDVLFVPPQWWHYVENLSTAISINTWVPMATDNLARLKECLVRFLVTTIKPTLTSEMCLELLNPNEDDIESSAECLEKLSHCITQLPVGHQNDSEDQGESLVKKRKLCHLNFKAVERISKEQIDNLMNSCSCDGADDQQKDLPLVFSLVNSFCDEKVLDNVSQNLLSHYT